MSCITKFPLGETSSLVVYEGDAILLTWLRHPGADLHGVRTAIEAARSELDDIERITNEIHRNEDGSRTSAHRLAQKSTCARVTEEQYNDCHSTET